MTARTLAAAALLAVLGTALAQPPKATEQPAAPAAPKAEKPDLFKKLATRVTVEKFDGKFKDALTLLADKYDLPLVLSKRTATRPLDNDGGAEPAAEQQVELPKLTGVTLESVLRVLCEQTDSRFLVYPDYIRIVPDLFADYESGVLSATPNSDGESPLLPEIELIRTKPLIKRALVNASFKDKPLQEVLDAIAESTGANVALSPLVPANVRQAPITVRFANTPVEAAVRTLCEMTDCGVIEDANVLVVSTRERAAARAKLDAEKLKAKQPLPLAGLGGGLGGVGGISAPVDNTAAELAKLKEQNEQLKQQLDDIQKRLKKLMKK